MRCPPYAGCARYQPPDLFQVHARCRPLREVLPKGVVEPVEGRGCGLAECGRRPGIGFVDDLPSRRDDVVGTSPVGGGEILAQQRGRAPRPEQQSHTETDREADRDVLDPDDADSPADGLNDVEEDEENDRKTGLACSKRDRAGSVGRQ